MRLHSGDSLGTGAAYAASVACAEEALLRREAASEAKRPKGPQGAALMRTECHAAFPGVPRKRIPPSARRYTGPIFLRATESNFSFSPPVLRHMS